MQGLRHLSHQILISFDHWLLTSRPPLQHSIAVWRAAAGNGRASCWAWSEDRLDIPSSRKWIKLISSSMQFPYFFLHNSSRTRPWGQNCALAAAAALAAVAAEVPPRYTAMGHWQWQPLIKGHSSWAPLVMVFADSNIQLRRRSGAGFHGAWRSCQDLGSQHRGQDDVAQRAQTDSKERVEEEQIALTLRVSNQQCHVVSGHRFNPSPNSKHI